MMMRAEVDDESGGASGAEANQSEQVKDEPVLVTCDLAPGAAKRAKQVNQQQ